MRYLISLLLTFTFYTHADDHDEMYSVAYGDYLYCSAKEGLSDSKLVAMESKKGVCSTNSDGSFHKACVVFTAEDYEQNYPDGLNNVHYPEATMLTKDAYLVRFYYEGVAGSDNQPYRTRVTTTWVNEDGNWVMRSQHYSSAAYGGVHQTVRSDFED